MEIVKAVKEDVKDIMKVIKECVKYMQENEVYQWDDNYPNKDIIDDDIKNGDLYAVKDNEILMGIIVINEKQAPEYKDLVWEDSDNKVLVIHRLSVHPSYHGKGFASKLMIFAEEYALKNGYTSIRFDCYSENTKSNSIYRKKGYSYVGQVYFLHKELPFNCYEKVLR